MTTSAGGGYGDDSPWRYEAREPGARRRKLAGYLKAANELRQTYQQSYMQSWNDGYGSEDRDPIPGAFPSTKAGASARSGEEEMILFPSYARKHVKQKPGAVGSSTPQEPSPSTRNARDAASADDADYGRTQWQQYEDDNAIVDVDVRGWVYTPHRGPLNRRNRLFVGLARQMVGVPAPASSPAASASSSRSTSPHPIRKRLEAHSAKHEEEIVSKEADSLMRKGEAEADAANKGAYSEGYAADAFVAQGKPLDHTSASLDDHTISALEKRQSWNAPAQMSQAELAEANSRLMKRLKPFLAVPVIDSPISAFFYNDSVSRQKTIDTDASGHFNLRAALDFIPTHVRILASDRLSATEEVHITASTGVSLISDVDDTVKHSAIAAGAREIFRNVFIRDLGDLTIAGVKEWYSQLSDRGVTFHYVSNSPWQLYPLLKSFFSMAGLPKGSFHLKQYSGMFQGIFEPVAERKKGTLERILRDFPEKQFLLIGDSGEADLEVYTDLVLENPGRVLGVYIRDVTTPQKTKFFDSSMNASTGGQHAKPPRPTRDSNINGQDLGKPGATLDEDDAALQAGIAASLADMEQSGSANAQNQSSSREAAGEQRPALPPRRQTEPAPVEEDLIDLNSDSEGTAPGKEINNDSTTAPAKKAPVRPPKPRMLSSSSLQEPQQTTHSIPRKAAPPLPRKPSTSVRTGAGTDPSSATPSSTKEPSTATAAGPKAKPPRPPPPSQQLLRTVYNSLPSASSYLPGGDDAPQSQPSGKPASPKPTSSEPPSTARKATAPRKEQPPPLPARLPLSSYPAAAAKYATSLYNSATAGSSPSLASRATPSPSNNAAQHAAAASSAKANGTSPSPSTFSLVHPNSYPLDMSSSSQGPAQANKKEELWKRRWARAEAILKPKGVVLRSWRVGGDVAGDSLKLVEAHLEDALVPTDS